MLNGFVTESDLEQIEECFPGIWGFYLEQEEKPSTFLELMWRFSRVRCRQEAPLAMAPPRATPVTTR
jgi:hypothetical protein